MSNPSFLTETSLKTPPNTSPTLTSNISKTPSRSLVLPRSSSSTPRSTTLPEQLRNHRIQFLKKEKQRQINLIREEREREKETLRLQKAHELDQLSSKLHSIHTKRHHDSRLHSMLYEEKIKSRNATVQAIKSLKQSKHTVVPVLPNLAQFESLTPRPTPRSCGGFYLNRG
ncbi:hypothetical protein P9112_006428 [Eukaryota sp. TZLM1-RC]